MDKTRRLDFSDIRLYGVTPSDIEQEDLLYKSEQTLKGGLDALQFRVKTYPDRKSVEICKKLKSLCSENNALFIVNDRLDIALASDADGLHVGQEDVSISFAREHLGHRKIIGKSCHSLPQAIQAQKEGADYVSCGPLFATPTKPTYEPVGLKLIGFYKAALRIPFVAIGGIVESNFEEVLEANPPCIAVVRAIFDHPDPKKATEHLKEKLSRKASV